MTTVTGYGGFGVRDIGRMQSAPPKTNTGAHHVAAALSGATVALSVALASADTGDVAFGAGMELALAFNGDEAVVPEWVQVFPKGPSIEARDGRRWTLDNPQLVLDAFARNKADLPTDRNHASEILAPKGGDAPAQGWVKAFEIRDGVIWARVDWNAAGKAAIASKSYRYISPAFTHTQDGRITGVKSLALVTHPALVMPALAQQQPTPPEKTSMTLSVRLAAVLGLAAAASDDQIYETVAGQVSLARDARDPTKLVPKADLDAALARATTAEGQIATAAQATKDATALAAVEAAIAGGKIAPASKDHWVSIAKASPEAFEQALASMQVTLTPPSKTEKKVGDDDAQGEHGLTEQQLSLCASLGLEPAAYAASLKDA